MAGLRFIAPALALAAGAFAQSSCGGGSSSTTTIQSNSDATGLASCSTYSGSIAIATGTTDNIQLNGIQTITGDLVANNVTQMASLAASQLQEIGGDFMLNGLTVLSTLNFPSLTTVRTIDWVALPALQGLSFTQGVQELKMLTVDNTQLGSLDGINLQVVDTVSVTNNPYLTSVNMQLGNVTSSLTFGANGKNLQIEFPNLIWAYNMTFRNASQVSIPSLASINGSLGFYSDTFQSLAAPNLTSVGGSLSFVSCNAVTNISMPQLTTVGGGFQLANNSMLANVTGFSALKTVGGALDFNGDGLQDIELPALSDVRGAFNLQSKQNITSACNHFQPLSGQNNVIKGTYTCKGETNPGGTGTLSPGTNSGSGSGSSASSSKGAAAGVIIPGATGVLGVVLAIFGML